MVVQTRRLVMPAVMRPVVSPVITEQYGHLATKVASVGKVQANR